MNSTNKTLLFDRFLIMYNLYVFTCIIFIFVFHCTHVRMSYVLNSYLLIYLLTYSTPGLLKQRFLWPRGMSEVLKWMHGPRNVTNHVLRHVDLEICRSSRISQMDE